MVVWILNRSALDTALAARVLRRARGAAIAGQVGFRRGGSCAAASARGRPATASTSRTAGPGRTEPRDHVCDNSMMSLGPDKKALLDSSYSTIRHEGVFESCSRTGRSRSSPDDREATPEAMKVARRGPARRGEPIRGARRRRRQVRHALLALRRPPLRGLRRESLSCGGPETEAGRSPSSCTTPRETRCWIRRTPRREAGPARAR